MGRKIALVGALLVASGIAVLNAFVVPPMTGAVTPMGRGFDYLLWFVPMIASLVLATGAVMLALAVLVAVTGRLPVRGLPRALLLWGVGAWMVSVVVETVLLRAMVSGAVPSGPTWTGLVLSQFSFVLQLGAASLLALWSVGLLAPEAGRGHRSALPVEDELRS